MTHRAPGGFTLIEVLVALAVLATGTMIALSLLTTAGAEDQLSRERAVAYKACQEVMEVLMTMDKATLLLQAESGKPLEFEVPALNKQNPPKGGYSITDVSRDLAAPGDNPPAWSVVEIRVWLEWKKIRVMLTQRRVFN